MGRVEKSVCADGEQRRVLGRHWGKVNSKCHIPS